MVRSQRPSATPPPRADSRGRDASSGEALLRLASRGRDRTTSQDNAKETLDPENVTDWDQLDVDINVKQIFQEVGLKPSQGARLIKSCHIQKEEDLISLTHSDIGSLGLQKLAERRFISLLQSWKDGGKGVGGKPEDTTKALNLLVTAGEKHNLQLVRDIVRSNNGKHVGVQQQACVTLRNMVAKDMTLREKAGQLGLLSDIQNAMRTYADSAGIQKQATGAIWNLVAGTPRNQEIAGRINILQELQTAMHNFEEHAEVQKMACGALWQLTLGNAMNKSKAGQQGLLQSLQKAMQRHPQNIDVQREACGAIRSLTSDNAKNKLIAGNIDLLAELQIVTENHINNPEILKEACGAMWIMIAGNKGNRLWAGQSVLLQDLKRVMIKYPYDSALQRQVAEAVMHITAHEPDNKAQAAGLELPLSLVEAMRAQSGSGAVETQVALCLATSHVCHQSLENKTQAKKCGLLAHIEDLMRNSPHLQVRTAATTACKHMRIYTREPRPGEVNVDLEEIMRVGRDIQNTPTPGSKSSMLFSPRTTPGAVSKLQRTFQSVRVISKLQMGLSNSSKFEPAGEGSPYQSPNGSQPSSRTGG